VSSLLLGLGGGVFAVARYGHGDVADVKAPPDAMSEARPAGAPAVVHDAATPDVASLDAAAPDAAAPPVDAEARTAKLSIDSVPSGATVYGPTGEALGRTPLKLDWPLGEQAVAFELRLGGYYKKQRETVVNSNTALHFELERLPVVHRPPPPSSKPNNSDSPENGLMRP